VPLYQWFACWSGRHPLVRVEWLANRGRSELWDRREQGKRIRMGAQASGRAREALRPCGLFVSPVSADSGFSSLDLPFAQGISCRSTGTCAFPTLDCAQSSALLEGSATPRAEFSRTALGTNDPVCLRLAQGGRGISGVTGASRCASPDLSTFLPYSAGASRLGCRPGLSPNRRHGARNLEPQE
jgi:hypothetical protein